MSEEFSLDIALSKEEYDKIKDLLTSTPGLRHYAVQLKSGEHLDLVEYKDYKVLEQENELLKKVKQYCPYDKKCGELYDCTKEEYETMKQSNVKLSLKYDQLKEVIEEVRELKDEYVCTEEYCGEVGIKTTEFIENLGQILEKAKIGDK